MKAYKLTLEEIEVSDDLIAAALAENVFDVNLEKIMLIFNEEDHDIPNCFLFNDDTDPDDVINEIMAELYY